MNNDRDGDDRTMDRVQIILDEIAKSSPASYCDEGKTIGAIYLPSDSIGVIIGQALAMRLDIQKLEYQAKEREWELESALRDLLNDCINFDGGKLTDIFMENASRALKQKPGDLDGNRGSEYSEQDRTGT